MKKNFKLITTLFLFVMIGSVFISCKSKDGSSDEKVTVEIFQFKIEIVEPLEKLIADFEAKNPNIDIVLDTVGGGGDYGAVLRQRVNSGEEPVIFNIGGMTDVNDWIDFLEPLNGESFIKAAYPDLLKNVTKDGKTYGMPYNQEGYGIMYNKAMLKKAGYSEEDLSKINTLSKLKALFADLDSKKADLGIDKVLSFSMGGSAWWTASIHSFNVPFAFQSNPEEFIAKAKKGEVKMADTVEFKNYVDMLEVYIKYSYDKLTTIEYNDQVTNFAQGKTAFLHQGNWAIGMIHEITPGMDVAYIPFSLGDDREYDSIAVGVPYYWAINKNKTDAQKAAAKKFIDFMMMSPRGHEYLVKDTKSIPPVKGVDMSSADPLAKSIISFADKGNIVGWYFQSLPNGYCNAPTSPVIKAMQKFYSDKDKAAFLKSLDENLVKLAK